MNHIDQHSLELYALQSEELELSARQIGRHLAECAGCRDLYLEIQEFYARAAGSIGETAPPETSVSEALARWSGRLPVFTGARGTGSLRWNPSPLARLYFGFRDHPALAGAGALMLGALAWILLSVTPRLLSDRNPAYASLNPGSSKLEAYNTSNELLWSVPVTGIEEARYTETTANLPSILVTDLDGDGRNEVVATLRSIGNLAAPEGVALAVMAADGKIRWHQSSGFPVQYRGSSYPNAWLQYGLIVADFDGDGRGEILCRASAGRSPWAILRYDMAGTLLGVFWHYGHLTKMHAVDFSRSGKTRILLGGANDTEGAGDFGYAVITLLNPVNILGRTEAVTTPGFGYSPSNAEITCIRLPNTVPNIRYRSKPGIDGFVIDSLANRFTFSAWWYASLPRSKLVLEYVFGPDMMLRDLLSTDATVRFLTELQQKGEMTSQEIEDFLPTLRLGVEYWDGKSWGKSPYLLAAQSP